LIAFKNYSLSLLLCATIQLKISSNSAYLFNFELLRALTQLLISIHLLTWCAH